jgi:two-component system, cell cycle response regulator
VTSPDPSAELVPLADRTGILYAFRLAMVVTVLAVSAVVPDALGASLRSLAQNSAIYILFVVSAETAQRTVRSRRLLILGAVLLADGVWICSVVVSTGGPGSLLASLILLHIVAVTLVASYRTGLKIAVWHCLLFVAAYYGMSTNLLPEWRAPGFGGAAPTEGAVLGTVVTFLAIAAATAVFSSLNERELRRRRGELRALAVMAGELQEVRSAERVVNVLLSHVLQSFGFPRAAVVVGDEDEVRSLWVGERAQAGEGRFPPVDARTQEAGQVLRRAWEQRSVQLVRNVSEDSGVLAVALPEAKNLVVVPMVADGYPIGALVVERGGAVGSMITRSRLNALVEFAAHASLSLSNAWLMSEIERLARIDELTGLANRRSFEESLAKEVARAARSGEPLSVVMFDVDHFKRLNDTHGHQRGDAVLRLMGQVLAESVRKVDIPARYGGEEFVLVLPNCPTENAVILADQVRRAITVSSGHLAVTVSAGVATMPVHALAGEELMRAADEVLYESKHAGRDRVTVSRRRLAAERAA